MPAHSSNRMEFTEAELHELEELCHETDFEICSINRLHRTGSDCHAVAKISYLETGGDKLFRVHQTVAFFYRPQHPPIPAFSVSPTSRVLGRLGRLAARWMSMPKVDLSAYPDAAEKFMMISFQPESTRKLINRDLLDAIVAMPECRIQTGKQALVISFYNEVIPEPDIDSFMGSATAVANQIFESARSLPPSSVSAEQEMLATAESMDGWMGKLLTGNVLASQDIDSFLSQSPPRTPSRAIRRRVYGGKPFLIAWSLFFSSAPILMSLMIFHTENNFPGAIPILLLCIALIAFFIMIFSWRSWWRLRRTLRKGELHSAFVTQLKATPYQTNDGKIFDIFFESAAGTSVYRGGRQPVAKARAMMKDQTETQILIDKRNPQKCIWLAGFPATP